MRSCEPLVPQARDTHTGSARFHSPCQNKPGTRAGGSLLLQRNMVVQHPPGSTATVVWGHWACRVWQNCLFSRNVAKCAQRSSRAQITTNNCILPGRLTFYIKGRKLSNRMEECVFLLFPKVWVWVKGSLTYTGHSREAGGSHHPGTSQGDGRQGCWPPM